MKLADVLKQDLTALTPQQRSHLRRRLLAANMPVPPELDLQRGQSVAAAVNTKPDESPWKCTVVAADTEHTYTIDPKE